MTQYIQSNQIVQLPAVNTNIDVADSGKILLVSDNIVYTLPPVQNGLVYRFINNNAALTGNILINAHGADVLYGIIINGPINGISLKEVNADGNLVFTNGKSLIGDFMYFISNGVEWIIYAKSKDGGGII